MTEIEAGKFAPMLDELGGKSHEELKELYVAREVEPMNSEGWEPDNKTGL